MKTRILNLLLLLVMVLQVQAFSVPAHSSNPKATATLFLDFDGHLVQSAYWNSGAPLHCAGAALTEAQISEIYHRVAEDFRPFDINVTTDSTQFLAAPIEMRMRIIVTPTSAWRANVGGISYITSFTWGDDTPAFVFSDRLENNPKFIAECCSHESGHTLGLFHQSRYDNQGNMTEFYQTGNGSGEIGWAPIMGNSYGKNMSGWTMGATQYSATELQDNLEVIVAENGFGFRKDDFGNEMNESAFNISNHSFQLEGVIHESSDADVFQFTLTDKSRLHLEVLSGGIHETSEGTNLDIQLSIYNENNVRIGLYNPADKVGVKADTMLNPGKYYIMIEGVDNMNMADYGSLGSYYLKGSLVKIEQPKIELIGIVRNVKHQLETIVENDEEVRLLELEISENGTKFKSIGIINPSGLTRTILTVTDNRQRYYRIKRINNQGQLSYSNVIALTSDISANEAFQVNNLIRDVIRVQATESFQYGLYDLNGNLLIKGKGTPGINQIELSGKPNGVYIMRLLGVSQQKSVRLVKQ
jgi:hypothetical protein